MHESGEGADGRRGILGNLRRCCAVAILAAVTALVPTVAMADPGTGGSPTAQARQHATAAVEALQHYYNATNGQFDTTGWWNSANALSAIITYSQRTGSTRYLPDIANTYERNPSFVNSYNDDDGWWALAWIRAYDLTGNERYLKTAESIFAAVAGYWDSTCNGGVWWSTDKTYKNAITNELFLKMAVELHQRIPNDTHYLSWATREWAWFEHSGMINSDHLVNDGLELSTCKTNHGTTWTYNQGVILGGLVGLYRSTGDQAYLDRARSIAHAAMTTLVDANGILTEPCRPITNCGADGSQFKGIFVRNLYELNQALHDQKIQTFLDRNAASIWANDRGSGNRLGLLWQGPYQQANASTQSSALDALNAALPLAPAAPAVSSISTPRLTMAAGEHGTATIEVHNLTRQPVQVQITSGQQPHGLHVRLSRHDLQLAAHSSATTTVRVDATAQTPTGFFTVTVRLRAGGQVLPPRRLTVLVAPPHSLLRAFNDVGVSSDTNPLTADLDGRGASYSAEALAAAGLAPGSVAHADGASLAWPVSAPGFPDNIRADGQTLSVQMPEGARQLVLLGTAVGAPDQTVTLHYRDHTTARLSAAMPDWTLDGGRSHKGPRVQTVATMPYRNMNTGIRQKLATYVFATSLPLAAGKTLDAITLPFGTPLAGLHVFALGWSSSAATAPAITAVTPVTAGPGEQVTITGTGFGAGQGSGYVTLTDASTTWGGPGHHPLTIDTWTDSAIAVTLPGDTHLAPGTRARVSVVDTQGAASNQAVLSITPSANPADYYDNVAISTDNTVACADIDGLGNSYSADAFAAAGITPGSTVSADGISYVWPASAACTADNILANGQTMLVHGTAGATRLGLLGTSVNGSSAGTVVVTYTDGTTTPAHVSFGDWFSGPTPSDTIVTTVPYRNTPNGSQRLTMKLYATTVPLDSGKTVASVTLPVVGDQVASGVAGMHVFAVALGR